MLIYNVTSHIEDSIHEDWLDWMQHIHIPDVLATGKFTKARLVRVLEEQPSPGATYAVQFYADCKSNLDKYYEEDAPRLRQQTAAKFGEKVSSFRTELQIICDHTAI